MTMRPRQQLLTPRLDLPVGSVDAHAFVRQSIGADLRAARCTSTRSSRKLRKRAEVGVGDR
jgi:hypothetical protein